MGFIAPLGVRRNYCRAHVRGKKHRIAVACGSIAWLTVVTLLGPRCLSALAVPGNSRALAHVSSAHFHKGRVAICALALP